jgi:hypothetical protein
MAKSILEALYRGEIVPFERPSNPNSWETEEKICNEKDYLKTILSHDDYTRLEYMESLYGQKIKDEENDLFVYSFMLGALIMQELIEQRARYTDDF